jgi:DNA modification methylase
MKVRLHCGDCREVLPTLAPGSYRAIVTGPPYFGAMPYLPEGHPEEGEEIGAEVYYPQYIARLVDIFRTARPLLTRDGALWLVSGETRPTGLDVPHLLAQALQSDGWILVARHEWHRDATTTDGVYCFAQSVLGLSRLETIVPRAWRAPAGLTDGATFYAVPSAVAADCIAASTHPGDRLLDPFAGTGTIGVEAALMGRTADLIETDPRQCWIATERLRRIGAGPGAAAA